MCLTGLNTFTEISPGIVDQDETIKRRSIGFDAGPAVLVPSATIKAKSNNPDARLFEVTDLTVTEPDR